MTQSIQVSWCCRAVLCEGVDMHTGTGCRPLSAHGLAGSHPRGHPLCLSLKRKSWC
jgi:hypothetical protein